MRFNPEIVRIILSLIEEIPAGQVFNGRFKDDEGRYTEEELNAHAKLLLDDGFLDGGCQYDHQNQPRAFWIRDLTMKGHEFMDNARNNTVWKQVVAKAEKQGTSISLSILNGLLRKQMEKYVGLGDDE
jgi:hypothetical protein